MIILLEINWIWMGWLRWVVEVSKVENMGIGEVE